MTQSTKDDTVTITIPDSYDDFIINLDNTYGTTTTYMVGDSVTDVVLSGSNDGTFTINTTDWLYSNTKINPDEVERMCNEYPSLEKVWRNFKSVYDMVKQDYDGKVKAGELDDDIPF